MNIKRMVCTALAAVFLSAAANAHITLTITQTGAAASGTATLGATFNNDECDFAGQLVLCAASLTPLPPPGIPLPGGGSLVILPDVTFNTTLALWGTQVVLPNGTGGCSGVFPPFALPPAADGLPLFCQAVALDLGPPLVATGTGGVSHFVF